MSILLDALKKSQREQPPEETPLPVTPVKPDQPVLMAAASLPPLQEPTPAALPEPPAADAAPLKISLMGILGVCALVATALCLAIVSLKHSKAPRESATSSALQNSSTEAPGGTSGARRDMEPVELGERPPAVATQVSKHILPKVDGIVWDPDSPLAIVAGRPLRVGESADGWTVQSITADQVRVERNGDSQVITLPEIPVTR